MKSLGRHVLVEFHHADSNLLNDELFIGKAMNAAALTAGATIVGSHFHTFNPFGVSGVVIIAESHLAIHTWPEHGYASVDLFTCGESVDPWKAFDHLKKALKADKYEAKEIRRGVFDYDVRHKVVSAAEKINSFEEAGDIRVVNL